MSELKRSIAIYLISSFFRFNQNEIDILNPRKKYNRLVFLLFQNDDLKKKDFCNFDCENRMQKPTAKIQNKYIFFNKLKNVK